MFYSWKGLRNERKEERAERFVGNKTETGRELLLFTQIERKANSTLMRR
jgi:hypothetical protein